MEIVESLIEGFSNDKLRKLLDRNDLFRPNDEDLEYFEFKEFENIKNLGNIDFEDGYRFGLFSAKVKANLSERSGKKEQFKLAKKIIIDRNLEVAIFAFYDDDSKFRLSLIYREYLGTKSEYSPYKRFTFYVDKSRTNKTFKSQIGKCNFKSFQEIKDAFSVEPVTKEFYNEIQSWYFWAIDKVYFPDDAKISDNPEKDKEIRNSENLIRLITRVIFIWFLKEKDLVPEILFSKDKLKEIVKDFLQGGSCNYYNAILQNLFFATLNCEISKRGFASNEGFIKDRSTYGVKTLYRYSDKFLVDNDKVLELFKSVPFLNGGLFDCLDKEDENNRVVYVDGFSRNEKKTAKIPDYLFFHEEEKIDITKYLPSGKKNVRGLLDILSTYNFTVDENTPFDQEIALDPELLGKVFENLLAAYNPETSTTARKATGSYYTPREIVDYMVEESLVQLMSSRFSDIGEDKLRSIFSYSDESIDISEEEKERLVRAIFNLKILDPACGSGAFPMGILHKLVFALNKLDQDNNYWYELQLEKARRDWNSELNRGDGKEIQDRLSDIDKDFDEALTYPDYARKLYLIENCIYGVDIQPIAIQISKLRFFISLVIDQKVDKSKENFGIQPLPNLETKFVAANTLIGLKNPGYLYRIGRIAELENELKELKHRYFRPSDRATKLRYRKKDKELRKRLLDELTKNHYSIEDSERIANFDMFDQNASADWFDPEWMFGLVDGFDIVIGNPPYIQLQKNHGELANRYKELGYEVLDRMGDIYTLFYEKGIKILKDGGHLCFITSNKWMRAGYGEKLREFFSKYNPKILIDLGPGVFESATVDTNILLIQKSENKNLLKAITLQKDDKEDIKKALDKRCVILRKLSKDAWFIGSDAEQRLKEKIERIGKRLKDWDVKIYRGILTGLNEAFIITTEKRNEILDNCKDEEERKHTEAIIKPILRGRDIKRYSYEWADLWVIVIPAGWTNEHRGAEKAEIFIEKSLPALMEHLKPYEVKAKKRDDQGDYWWELRHCAYYPEFEKEKVVWNRITDKIIFSYVKQGFYILDSTFMFTGKDLKYLIALLNSKVIAWWIKLSSATLGKGSYGAKIYIEKTPIPPITPDNEPIVKQIENDVETILSANLSAKRQNLNADISHLEREIDQLVYRLYDLTEEEIKVIEKILVKERGIRMGDLLKNWKIFNLFPDFKKNLRPLPDKEKIFIVMGCLSGDICNVFRNFSCLISYVESPDKNNQQSQVEDGFIDFIRKCDFSNWAKEDLEKLIDMAYKSVGKLKNYISYTKFKEFFGEPTEAHLGILSNYLISSLKCSEEESIKIICYINILYYSILRCKDEYRGDLIRKLYNLTENSGNNFNKFLFQMILSELVKNDWEKLKEFFWEYNYFSKTKDEIFWLPYDISNFNSKLFAKLSGQDILILQEYQEMFSDLVKDICESLDDSDIEEFRKIFHIDKFHIDELKSDPNGIAEIKQHLEERKKTCSKVFSIAGLDWRNNQKEEEKRFLEFFCERMRDEYGLHIEGYKKEERPDFIVLIDGKRVGIELTTYNTEEERRNSQPETEVKLISAKKAEKKALPALEEAIYKKIKKYKPFRHSEEMDELKIDELWLVLYSPNPNYETSIGTTCPPLFNDTNLHSNLNSLKESSFKDDTTFELISVFVYSNLNSFVFAPKPVFIRNESALFKKR